MVTIALKTEERKDVVKVSRSRQPVCWGLLTIALGEVWLLNNLGVTQVDLGRLISTYWPVISVLWGPMILAGGFRAGQGAVTGSVLNGLHVPAAGFLFLGRNLGLYELDLSLFGRCSGRWF